MTTSIETKAQNIQSSILTARAWVKKSNEETSAHVGNAKTQLVESFNAVRALDKAAACSIVASTLALAVSEWDLRAEAIQLTARWVVVGEEGKIVSWGDFSSRESLNRLPRTIAAGAVEKIIVGDGDRPRRERKRAISALTAEIVREIARLTGKPTEQGERKPGKQKLLASIGEAFLQFAGDDLVFTIAMYTDLSRLRERTHKDQSDFDQLEELLHGVYDAMNKFRRAYPNAKEQG